MSTHTPRGTFFTTDDLVRMARLDQFGQYSKVIERALIKLRQLEIENSQLKQALNQLVDQAQAAEEVVGENSDIQEEYYTNETSVEETHLIDPDIDY